jgi:hypothetical protein
VGKIDKKGYAKRRNVRLIFRTGDTLNGKTLKSFMLLKATVGNTGATRSINAAA